MKYELTDETTKTPEGKTLYRIKALKDFGDVKAGQLGGFVESMNNLDQTTEAWISNEAKVWGNSLVTNNSQISHQAEVFGDCKIVNSTIGGLSIIFGKSVIEHSTILDAAEVSNSAVYKCIINDQSLIDHSTIKHSYITGHSNIGKSEIVSSGIQDSFLGKCNLYECHFERIHLDKLCAKVFKQNMPGAEFSVKDGIEYFKNYTLIG